MFLQTTMRGKEVRDLGHCKRVKSPESYQPLSNSALLMTFILVTVFYLVSNQFISLILSFLNDVLLGCQVHLEFFTYPVSLLPAFKCFYLGNLSKKANDTVFVYTQMCSYGWDGSHSGVGEWEDQEVIP